jgi:hypothetical protein
VKEFKVICSLTVILMMLPPLIFFESNPAKFALIYSQTEDQCTDQINTAEERYQAGKWTEAIELIKQCLIKSNLSAVEKGKAYRILSLVYIAMQSEKEANDAVKNMLEMIPYYKIDSDRDPPSLQKMINVIAQSLNPEITSITPKSIMQREDGFTMIVKGSNFTSGSEVRFNGIGKSTTFISDTELQAKITANDVLKADEYEITVYSPILKGRTSNIERFMVETSSMAPWKWFALGSATIAIVVATIFLLKPYPEDTTIADPPARP